MGLVAGQSKDFQIQAGDENSILLKLKDAVLFAPGSDQLSEVSQEMLEKVEASLANFKDLSVVNIEGHTDDNPIFSARFPSNWELSSARSARIARLFFEKGLKKPQLVSEGYAESRPLVPNRDDEGTSIPENQSLNRRVVIRLKFENPEAQNANAKLVLEKIGAEVIQGKPKSPTADAATINDASSAPRLAADADLDTRFQEAQARLEEAKKKLRSSDEEKRKKQKIEDLEKKIKDVENKIQQGVSAPTSETKPLSAPKKQEGSK
jgi:outer membrane protein OmpA-like peptidoglycan-associated protein